jgi:glucan-binding YG repeat protein
MQSGQMIGDFICDKSDFLSVHSNSICFGTEYYDKNDKYPLMYICVYNNYEGHANQYEGHCGVYRITENGSDFEGDLVQVIKIGFTEDLNMWKSLPNRGDVCPFGNFIVDTDKNDLYAYVMRDATQTTRYYKFDLPKVSDGEYNSLFGCKTVTLNVEDIKDQFDTEYSVYLQGADYVDGLILSSSGLGRGREGGAILRLVDLESKKVVKTFNAMNAGVYNEPEVIAVDPDTKKVYYGSTDGQLRYLTCIDEYLNKSYHNEHTYSESYKSDNNNHWLECDVCGEKKDVTPHEYTNACDTDCNVCGKIRVADNHLYDNACDTDCNVCGKVREIIHNFAKATCTEPETCTVCGITKGEALGHSFVGGTCITKGVCSVCGVTSEEVNPHVYDNDSDFFCNICGICKVLEPTLVKVDGVWHYYVDGYKSNDTTLVDYKGKTYYVFGGVWNKNIEDTLYKINGKWHYVKDGKFASDATTLVKYNGKWYHVENGLKTTKTTLVKYNGKWYYVEKGVKKNVTKLFKYNSKYYYVKSGKVSFTTGIQKISNKYYYIKNGKWDKTTNTLYKKSGKYYAVKSGMWYKSKAIIKYNGKKYYCNKGYAQTKYSGKVTVSGKKYTVKKGIVK